MRRLLIILLSINLTVDSIKIEKSLVHSLKQNKKLNILITMKDNGGSLLSNMKFENRQHQLNTITTTLQSQSWLSQKNILFYLKNRVKLKTSSTSRSLSTKPMQIESLWISNQIIVRGASPETIQHLAGMKNVENIQQEKFFQLNPFMENVSRVKRKDDEIEWGLQKIQVTQVWKQGYKGQGIRVGIIDTGARWTHESLLENYVGKDDQEYGWYDPQHHSDYPMDDHGHGSHVLGTLAGSKGIGVAPEVKWMACKGCYGTKCSSFDLAACLQFMTCPTDSFGHNQNCSQAPQIVSNSWGGSPGDTFYRRYIDTMEAAGIILVFAIGNSGPFCSTVNSPGDFSNVIGVGATTSQDKLAYFSSVGPTLEGLVKPNIVAPGHLINSAHGWRDDSYTYMSGTSMACPLVAGVVALMLSKNPNLTIGQVRQILFNGSDPIKSTEMNCGGIYETNYPNHHTGHGRVNAFKSVQLVTKLN